MNPEEKSEFGKGCVYCLLLFASHFGNDQWNEIMTRKSNEQYLTRKIRAWANGASDHLFELEIPKGNEELEETLLELAEKGLRMGHSSTDTLWTTKDLLKLRELTYKAGMLIDEGLRIEVSRGEWE